MAEKKLSIIDVAKKAGVSTATVSRVLNGNGGYSKKTEEKVLQTVEECGFTPNGNAISLITNRSHCVGVIVPDITNEFFAKIVHELDIFFLKHQYSLLICDSNEDYKLENMHIRNLLQKNVEQRQHQNADKRAGKAPAERGHAEKLDAACDDELAQRRVRDLVGVDALDMLVCGAGVVYLVKVAAV